MDKIFLKYDSKEPETNLAYSILGLILLYDDDEDKPIGLNHLRISLDIFPLEVQKILYAFKKYRKKYEYNAVLFSKFCKEKLEIIITEEQLFWLVEFPIGSGFYERDQDLLLDLYKKNTLKVFKNKASAIPYVIDKVFAKDISDTDKIKEVKSRFIHLCDLAIKNLGGK